MARTLAEIERDEQRLAAEKAVMLARDAKPWPRRHIAYLHSSKESMWEEGREIGLSDQGCNEFCYALYEVAFELSVYEDGTYTILSVDNRALAPKKGQ